MRVSMKVRRWEGRLGESGGRREEVGVETAGSVVDHGEQI